MHILFLPLHILADPGTIAIMKKKWNNDKLIAQKNKRKHNSNDKYVSDELYIRN